MLSYGNFFLNHEIINMCKIEKLKHAVHLHKILDSRKLGAMYINFAHIISKYNLIGRSFNHSNDQRTAI